MRRVRPGQHGMRVRGLIKATPNQGAKKKGPREGPFPNPSFD